MLQSGVQLLERFAQDDRVRIRQPRPNSQIKFTKPLAGQNAAVPEAVGAASRVTVSGSGVTKVGPGQYAVSLSLSQGQTIQLTPGTTDAQNNVTSAIGTFRYKTRNRLVATVSTSGLVTPISRGGVCILIGYPSHQVNASFDGAAPSGTEGIFAELQVTVLA